MTDWLTMTPDLFDTDPKPVQLALCLAPDPLGTPDLLDLLTDGQESG